MTSVWSGQSAAWHANVSGAPTDLAIRLVRSKRSAAALVPQGVHDLLVDILHELAGAPVAHGV